MLGLAVGDALGSPTEGKSPEEIASRWGRVTDFLSEDQSGSDDTEYALFSAQLLLQHGKALSSSIVSDAYREKIINAQNSYKGAGFSEMIAIHNLLKGMNPPASGEHLHSWSDGLAMRVAPYGIAAAGDPIVAARLAKEDGMVANAGEGIYAGQAVAAAIAVMMNGETFYSAVNAALASIPDSSWTAASIIRGVAIGKQSADVWNSLDPLYHALACSFYYWPDVAPEAVGMAFGIVVAAKGKFQDAVLGAVNLGRDTDTIAGIAGAICGAGEGAQVIPEQWSKRISRSRGICISAVKDMDILETADALARLAESWRNRP